MVSMRNTSVVDIVKLDFANSVEMELEEIGHVKDLKQNLITLKDFEAQFDNLKCA